MTETNPIELYILGWTVVLGLVQMLLGSVAARTQQGYAWGMGPRDEASPISGVPARLQRAFDNYMETFPLFAAAMLCCVLLGHTGPLTEIGGWVYLVARSVYVAFYAAGTPIVRTLVWIVAKFGLFAVLASLFLG